jgi:fumarylacetoacetate (FAA) hydrolase family protein
MLRIALPSCGSPWNNPEPESSVLVVMPPTADRRRTLGNDVNLRDFEGRSALLLGKAKDNNRQCARRAVHQLFDGPLSRIRRRPRRMTVTLHGSTGPDGYRLDGTVSPMNA